MMTIQEELGKLRPELKYLRVQIQQEKRGRLAQKNRADEAEEELKRVRKERNLYKKRSEKLQKELEKIKRQRDTYKGMIFKPNISKDSPENRLTDNTQTDNLAKKKLGGQAGHLGKSRKLPQRVDQVKRVFAYHCPSCGESLKRTDSVDTHTVEDLPYLGEIKTEVSQYEIERQWCSNCSKEVVVSPPGVMPHSRLGIYLIIQILIWRYACRMPIGVITSTLEQTYGVVVTTGAVIDILNRSKGWFGDEYSKLLKIIRGSPIKHADETSWRINGLGSWLWAFLTQTAVYYSIETTRGKGVAEKVLADSRPSDVLIRDDYPGYKNLALRQQACWAHLLRVTREAKEHPNASEEIKLLYSELSEIFDQLNIMTQLPFDKPERVNFYSSCQEIFEKIINHPFKDTDVQAIQVRITNQQRNGHNNYLTAILFDNVPLTNNLAERGIRQAVVARKISGGSRSTIGAETFAVNMSIIQTIKLRSEPLIPTLHSLILKAALGKTN